MKYTPTLLDLEFELPDRFHEIDWLLKLHSEPGLLVGSLARRVHDALRGKEVDLKNSDSTTLLLTSNLKPVDVPDVMGDIYFQGLYDGDRRPELYVQSDYYSVFPYIYSVHHTHSVATRGMDSLHLAPGLHVPDRTFLDNWRKYAGSPLRLPYIQYKDSKGFLLPVMEGEFRSEERITDVVDRILNGVLPDVTQVTPELWVRPLTTEELTAVSRHKMQFNPVWKNDDKKLSST